MRAYASALSNRLAFRSLCWQWEKGEELVLFWSANIVEALAITLSVGLSILAVFLCGGAVIAHFKLSKSRQRERWLVTSHTNSSSGVVWCQINLSAEPSSCVSVIQKPPVHTSIGICQEESVAGRLEKWTKALAANNSPSPPPPPPPQDNTDCVSAGRIGLTVFAK